MTKNILSGLIIYRRLLNDETVILYNNVYKKYLSIISNEDNEDIEEYIKEYYNLSSALINLHCQSINDYLADMILKDENIFSLSAERGQVIDERIKKAVIHDIVLLKKLFELPSDDMAECAGDFNKFICYKNSEPSVAFFTSNKTEAIYEYIYNDYKNNGCGAYRNNYAFSINDKGSIVPLDKFNPIHMDEIYGYKSQKNKIVSNTEKFVSGKYALNTLLVGDSGTGKSTAVKSLIPMFKNRKLRLIEAEKEKIYFIPQIIETLKNRGMYFIIFIDDLSFESNENSYKYLKSAVEGSILEQPDNILFYVTSNRKHLIKENMSERQNEVHMTDAINEQTSLSERFGLTIIYNEPNQNEYFEIVLGLAEKYNVKYENKEQFLAEAKKYAMQNGGRTGRSAVQFIRTI